jgi:hypothetical protein
MRFSRTSIAAAVTIVALGALAAVALASGGNQTTTAPAPTAETDPPAQVRTETVHRTVQRDRSASSDDDGTVDQGPGDAPRTPVAPAQTTRHDVDDDHGDDDTSGPGSSHSGRGGGDDDGPDHDRGDDHGGHGGGDDD